MRKLLISAGVLIGAMSAISSANAITPGPIPIQSASPVQDVQYACRRVRVCGPYGCTWRRQCWENPGYYGGYGYYRGPYRGYYRGYYPPGAAIYNPCGPGWSVQDGVCKPYRGY